MSRSTLDPAARLDISLTGLSPSPAGFPNTIQLCLTVTFAVLNPLIIADQGLASYHFARRYFSPDMCSLPWLFAAYRVLLRLLVPRHPPYALLRLINSSACPMLNCVSSSMKPSVSSHNLPPSAFFHAKPLFEVILFFGSFLSLLKLSLQICLYLSFDFSALHHNFHYDLFV